MKKKGISYALLVSLLLSLSSGVAFAKDKVEEQKAQVFFIQGMKAYVNQSITEAARYFTEASKLMPDDPKYNLMSAEALRTLKQPQSAIRHYLSAIDKTDGSGKKEKKIILLRSYLGLAQAYIANNQKDKALETATKATEVFPDKFLSYYALGKVYENMKKPDDAISAYNKSLEIDKEQLESYLALASLYNSQKKTAKVIETYKQACDYRPLDESMKIALAQVYFTNKDSNGNADYNSTIDVLENLLVINPKHATARYYLAISYAVTDRLQQAEEQLSYLGSLNPTLANRLARELQEYVSRPKPQPINENHNNDGGFNIPNVPTISNEQNKDLSTLISNQVKNLGKNADTKIIDEIK